MLKNYIKIALRNLKRSKAFSFINVAGLAFGVTCALLISAYVWDELHYDNYSENASHIYRVGLKLTERGGVDDYPMVDVAVGAGMKNAFPEIVSSTRISGTVRDYITYGDIQFKEEKLGFADANFFSVFSIPLAEGNPETALIEPNTIVLSRAMAKKYFGEKSAMNQVLLFSSGSQFKVTGIYDEIPHNTHFHYDALISGATGGYWNTGTSWTNIGFYTYLVLNPHSDPKVLEAKFPELVKKFVVPEIQHDMGVSMAEAEKSVNSWKFYLTPVQDIHLHSATKYELEANGDMKYVYIFSALAFFIVVLACINFTNLSTASASKRSREVGIRKVMGSKKNQLVNQFLMESVLLSIAAIALAMLFTALALPLFNNLAGKNIPMSFFYSPLFLGVIAIAAIIIGIAAGIYPAFFLSSFEPVRVLKGNDTAGGNKRFSLRSGLVVFQFAVSTSLIIATIIVYQQLHYMQNLKLGYDKDQVLVVESARSLGAAEESFRQQLMQDHRVINASITNDAPVGEVGRFNGTEIAPKDATAGTIHTSIFNIDDTYFPTMGMTLVAGRNFIKDFPADSSAAIINETAMHDLGWTIDDVIGKTIFRSAVREYNVVGVVKDFHYTSARQKIAPLMLLPRKNRGGSLIIKMQTADISAFLGDLKTQWKATNASVPLDYYFLDDKFENLYQSEQKTENIFIAFVVIAIIIACLGLYGLSAFSASQRVKEIGVRKVLGSSVPQIIMLLSGDFLKLVGIAFALAVPLSWWAMHRWLENFNYRVSISLWIFVAAGVAAASIALLTVSFQAIKAALVNPVRSLRNQ